MYEISDVQLGVDEFGQMWTTEGEEGETNPKTFLTSFMSSP